MSSSGRRETGRLERRLLVRRRWWVITVVLLASMLTLCGRSASAQTHRVDELIEQALASPPDGKNGRELYEQHCSRCHGKKAFGDVDTVTPALAGQSRPYLIKQIADVLEGLRQLPDMHREVSRVKLAKMPALRDISAYLSELPMLTQPERGSGSELVLGGRIYRAICAECHGVMGLGDGESPMPNLRGQHYSYLLQQGRLLAAGHRYSVDAQVSALLEFLSMRELTAVSDYISRMADSSESRASNDADGSEFQPALMHFWFAEIVVTSKPIAACDGRRRADDRAERVHVEYPKYLLGSSTYSAARKGLHDQLMQQSCHQPFGRRGLTCRMPCCAN